MGRNHIGAREATGNKKHWSPPPTGAGSMSRTKEVGGSADWRTDPESGFRMVERVLGKGEDGAAIPLDGSVSDLASPHERCRFQKYGPP